MGKERDTMIDPKKVLGTPEWIAYVFACNPPAVSESKRLHLSTAFEMVARDVALNCPPSADRTVALRKLREALHAALDSIALGGVG